MSTEYLLALDAGSGSGRSVLVSTDGQECHTASADWGYQYEPEAGDLACHFDPDVFWSGLASTVREVLAKAGADGGQVISVSSTSQREGCVLLDGRGCELYAGPNRDNRATAEGIELGRARGDEIYARTGHYPSGMFAAARLKWFQRHRPELYERAASLLMINDWVLYRLSGEMASEPTNAAETCLFDIDKGAWADDLIKDLGLRRDLFAQVVASGARIGVVTEVAGSSTGLVPGTPVVVGGADTQCGVLGSGAIDDGDMAVVAGTTTPLQIVLSDLALDPVQRMWSGCFLVPGRFVLESNAGGAGTIYQWCADTFFGAASVRRGAAGDSPFALINTLAEATPPGAFGARSFLGVAVMNARALPQPPATIELGSLVWHGDTKAAVARAILESLAFAARANADQISTLVPGAIGRVTACGGLTQSALYVSLLAALLERPISVPRWREGSGVGAAICAGLGAGVFKSLEEGQRKLVNVDLQVEPDPVLVSAYRKLYPAWLRDYAALAARN
jgi:sugar (pentulose or hexulose) kinase